MTLSVFVVVISVFGSLVKGVTSSHYRRDVSKLVQLYGLKLSDDVWLRRQFVFGQVYVKSRCNIVDQLMMSEGGEGTQLHQP